MWNTNNHGVIRILAQEDRSLSSAEDGEDLDRQLWIPYLLNL